MNVLIVGILAWIVVLASCVGVAAFERNRLPRDAKPLKEIVEAIEKSGYIIVEAEIDYGRWEIDAHKGDESYELHVDPVTGEIISTHRDDVDPAPPASAMKLSKLLNGVTSSGYATVVSAEFKHGQWEVEAYQEHAKHELKVDAESGKILSDRTDD